MIRPTRNSATPRALPALLLTAAILALPGPAARAGLTSFDAFFNQEYTQTANNTAPSGTPLCFFSSRLSYSTAGDITTATGNLTGGGTSFGYTNQPGNLALYQTPFITQTQLFNQYLALGPFNVTILGGNLNGESGSAGILSPIFTSAVPYLTGNSYNQLQGLNAATADAVTFNNFAAVAGSNESDIFVTITKTSTNSVVYSSGALSNTSSSIGLAANTLAAGTTYSLEVDFSSRLNSTPFFNQVMTPFTAGYDVRTEVSFTTAPLAGVPEPASLALSAIGMASAVLALRARRRK